MREPHTDLGLRIARVRKVEEAGRPRWQTAACVSVLVEAPSASAIELSKQRWKRPRARPRRSSPVNGYVWSRPPASGHHDGPAGESDSDRS